jgi:hypothetical protein
LFLDLRRIEELHLSKQLNMKKVLLIAFVWLGTLSFQNAEKEARIKKITNLDNKSYSEYSYTRNGRIARIVSSTGTNSTYEYFNDTIIKITKYIKGAPVRDTIILNKRGLAEISTEGNSRTVVSQIEYDREGFMTNQTLSSQGMVAGTSKSIIRDGNVVSNVFTAVNNVSVTPTYYTFYTDKPNTISKENMGMDFYGKTSKNLIKESMQVAVNGDTIRHLNKYEFDSEGRVKLKVSYNPKLIPTDSTLYEYY